MTNKYTGQISTGQYEFLNFEIEGTAQDAVEAYKELQTAWKGGEGVSSKDFNAFLDTYISTGKPGELEVWENMTDQQKIIVNEVKKSFARIKSKNN